MFIHLFPIPVSLLLLCKQAHLYHFSRFHICALVYKICFSFWLTSLCLTVSRSIHGGGNGTPLQYSCLENPMDGGAWWAAVHGVAKSRTWLSDFTFTFHFHAVEKEMATHSSVLAWRIPGTEEPGGLPSMGSQRVGHNWSDLAAAAVGPSTSLFTYLDVLTKYHHNAKEFGFRRFPNTARHRAKHLPAFHQLLDHSYHHIRTVLKNLVSFFLDKPWSRSS